MIKYYENLIQGSDEWFAQRCGLLTASEMKYIITPKKLQYAQNDKEKAHLYELAAQRATSYVEPSYISDDMLRGQEDESYARETYHEQYAAVQEMGFITNDKWGFTLGYSPDGLVGNDGQIEAKSRKQKFQFETIIKKIVPEDFIIQIQTGLMVTERKYSDFITYCGGMHMMVLRVEADKEMQDAIADAATIFHKKLEIALMEYKEILEDKNIKLIPTKRTPRDIIL